MNKMKKKNIEPIIYFEDVISENMIGLSLKTEEEINQEKISEELKKFLEECRKEHIKRNHWPKYPRKY